MDTTALIVELASTSGALGSAMPDVLNRSTAYFSATEVNAETVQEFLTGLRETAPHLFTTPAPAPGTPAGALPPAWMSPAERLTWAREHRPTAPVQRRPQPYAYSTDVCHPVHGKVATQST